MLRRLLSRARHLFRAARFRRELDAEMAFHVERLTEDLVRGGMEPKEARRQARIRFGSPERVHDRAREERGLALLDETGRHVRLAIRGMLRSPLFSVAFVATLALCIGMGTAVFSVVDAVLWRPLPYPAPERLAHAVLYDPAFGKWPGNIAVDGRAWEAIREQGEPLDRAVYSGWVRGVNLTTDAAAAFVRQQRVGAGYFRTLGVPPLLGREFDPSEDTPDGAAVAILSHGLWTRTFGADPEMLGRTIRLKGEAHTVVGIMPPDFRSDADADVWTPLRPSTTGEGGGANYAVLVRIPEGMSLAEADAHLAGIEAPPSGREGAPELRFGAVAFAESLSAGLRLPMLILLGAIGLMLVVGCLNLAGLQVARALARRPEIATRQALGSGAGSLARQMVTENLALGVCGGAAGIGLAYLGVAGLEGLVQSNFGIWQEIRVDGRALTAAAALTALATLLFGLVPVVQAANPGVYRILVSGSRVVGRGGHKLRKVLLVGQVAIVTALLFAAGLLVRSYGHLGSLDPGFEREGLLTVQFSLDDARYAEAAAVQDLFARSLEGIRGIPGVSAAAVSLTLPYERPLNTGFRVPGEDNGHTTNSVYVTPGFFETLGIPLLQGRVLRESDRAGAPMVVVANQAFVDTYLGGGPAVGTRLNMGFFEPDGGAIVGVVGNVQQAAGWGDTSQPVWETPTLYLSAAQASSGFFQGVHVWFAPSWTIRVAGVPSEIAPQVTQVFAQIDEELPVARIVPLTEVIEDAFATQRFEATFLIVVASLALLLAGIGLYGIVAHEVLERRTEMGLRMALGASPPEAVWAAGVGGLRLTFLGLLVGGFAAVGVSRIMEGLIWGVTGRDPATLSALLAALAVLALVASFVPAARVGRMHPATILREQ